MTHETTIKIPKSLEDRIIRYTTIPVKNESDMEFTSRDMPITETAKFENGYEMDIKCCGVDFEEDSDNTAWLEAVLFNEGNSECCCTEPEFEQGFVGDWELECDDNTYIAHVVLEEEN